MAAIIFQLSRPENRPYQDRLRQELQEAGVRSGAHPDISIIQQLPFLTDVIRETLRVDPPVPFGPPRIVKEGQDVTVMGVRVEPGVSPVIFLGISLEVKNLNLTNWCILLDPNLYPHLFAPSRSGSFRRSRSLEPRPMGFTSHFPSL